MKILLRRLLAILLVLAVLYLISVNVALNLPATRALLNGMQPDRFSVSWQRAWSAYPLHVELRGVAADGQTPTEQWQVDAARAAASVSLLPLLRGEIRVHDLDLADIDVRLRPRPMRGAESSQVTRFFPVIRNRDPDARAEASPAQTAGTLVLEIDDLHVTGQHAFWISHIRGSLPGEVRGSFRLDTEAGRLSLSGGALDLALASLQVGPEQPVTEDAAVRGRIEIPAFKISETQGLELLRLPELDAELDLPVQNLDFLAWLMPQLAALELHGRGRLRGRAVLSAGELLAGTDLIVEARELAMSLGAYRFGGDGIVEMRVDPEDEAQADLTVRFDRVQAQFASAERAGADAPPVLFTGRGLTAELRTAERDPTTTSDAQTAAELIDDVDLAFQLTIPSMQVDDLSVYNRLFPADWQIALLGGTGTISGVFKVTAETVELSLDLASDEADLRLRDYHANTDLLLQLRAALASRGPGHDSATLDMAGTLFQLDEAQLAAAAQDSDDAQSWSARFLVNRADLTVPLSAEQAEDGAIPAVAQMLSQQGFGALLASADGGASAILTVSQLDWIAGLLGRPLGLRLKGTGELDADIKLIDGSPAVGSVLRIPQEILSVTLLEHQIDGMGSAAVALEGQDANPRARLTVAFEDGRMHRRGEAEPSVGEVRMDAEVVVADPFAEAAADAAASAELSLVIHSARVLDMRTYNPYLPEHGPVSLLGGQARLVGDLAVASDKAAGELLLTADALRVSVADQELSGDLRVEVLIRDGSAEDLRFDIGGSSLVLDGFRVVGSTRSATDEDWGGRIQVEEAEVLWQKPMQLGMKADIAIKDTRPFVAILDNAREKHDWVGELLTLEDLGGHVLLDIDGEDAVLADAMISAPEIGVHAKGRISAAGREAMLLLRWHSLSGALELHNDRRAFHLTDAWEKFDAYVPGQTLLPLSAEASSAVQAAPALRSVRESTPQRDGLSEPSVQNGPFGEGF